MACAALKRPHNFDLLGTSPQQPLSSSPKRRRCGAAVSVSPSRNISPFAEATPKLNIDELANNVHDEWRRIHRRRKTCSSPPSSTDWCSGLSSMQTGSSTLQNTWSSSLNPGRQTASKNQSFNCYSPPRSMSPGSLSPNPTKEQPSLTFKQVISFCERLWKEREEKLKEEYDKVLNERLAEQYDSFLKFTQDQIMRKYHQSSCSYVS